VIIVRLIDSAPAWRGDVFLPQTVWTPTIPNLSDPSKRAASPWLLSATGIHSLPYMRMPQMGLEWCANSESAFPMVRNAAWSRPKNDLGTNLTSPPASKLSWRT
jgi:hypothetical protein